MEGQTKAYPDFDKVKIFIARSLCAIFIQFIILDSQPAREQRGKKYLWIMTTDLGMENIVFRCKLRAPTIVYWVCLCRVLVRSQRPYVP